MIHSLALALMTFLIFAVAHAQDLTPTKETIIGWWNQPEKVEIGEVRQITLLGGEVAYLASAQFPDRGRNFSHGAILARPSQQKAIDLSTLVDFQFDIVKLSSYPVSHIVTTPWASGQGTHEGTKTLLYFSGWEPIVVLTRLEYDDLGVNEGACPSKSRSFDWKFIDLNNDETLDLVEVRVDETKALPRCLLKKKTATRRYRSTEKLKFIIMGSASPKGHLT